MLRDKQN